MATTRTFCISTFFLILMCSFSSIATPPKVSLSLYYETLCPYCSNFIVNYLSKIFNNGIIDIVDLNLVPYGNARIQSNGSIVCQHGPYECLLNTVEACAISAWEDLKIHFGFINCVESLVVAHTYLDWQLCYTKTGLSSRPIDDCIKSGYGNQIILQYARETDALQPPHRYVPWVVVNGVPLYEDYQNFESYVCKAYKGSLPEVCKTVPLRLHSQTETTTTNIEREKMKGQSSSKPKLLTS